MTANRSSFGGQATPNGSDGIYQQFRDNSISNHVDHMLSLSLLNHTQIEMLGPALGAASATMISLEENLQEACRHNDRSYSRGMSACR